MTPAEHMLAAEAQMLLADAQIRPNTEEDKSSPHLHTAMFHLEAAIAVLHGRAVKLPEPVLSGD